MLSNKMATRETMPETSLGDTMPETHLHDYGPASSNRTSARAVCDLCPAIA
jgi:hypothetical protein